MGFFEWFFGLFEPLRDLLFPKERFRGADRRRIGSGAKGYWESLRAQRRAKLGRIAERGGRYSNITPAQRLARIQRAQGHVAQHGFSQAPRTSSAVRLPVRRPLPRAMLPVNRPVSHRKPVHWHR